jgi:hypothetical protein
MVSLYTWFPTTPADVVAYRKPPDFGHSALQTSAPNGHMTYASFWPEPESLIGKLSHFLKEPPDRCPSDYTTEIDPDGDYLRRPADRIDQLDGLDETRIAALWPEMCSETYDVRTWNCSSLTRFLILRGMDRRYYERVKGASGLSIEDMEQISDFKELVAIVDYLACKSVIETTPGDVVKLAEAYQRVRSEESAPLALA